MERGFIPQLDYHFADAGTAVGEVKKAYPKATLVQYDPAIAGTSLASGLNVQYDLAEAM